ncbi:hypothetical protein DLAC_11052 [Tieghemostelium lacteum]|uniref:PH domain-containing protein n=1 Tax=Tieghemostelium lacteum TaxID=361077 RepID=A0A151Z321_TIELA|nr:hypothetical protein DLAC_11052 [Tieghemostelium lacteum]|eukprot:KYQ88352.1 hypothetical protein DLAC_11052 [Tieghemostelium lacteum]
MTSIFQYVKEGNKEEVTRLLKENTKEILFIKDSFEQTPLHVACFEGYTDVVSLLVKKGSKIEQKDRNGWTPLHCAASAGHFKCCEVLISKDVSLALIPANDLTTPFHYLVRRWDPVISPKLLAIIIKHDPTVVNITGHNQETPLHHACLKNCEESIAFLLQHNSNINLRSKNGETCLSFAIRAGYKGAIKLLLEHGSDAESYKLAHQLSTELQMHDIQSMLEENQQSLKIRTNVSRVYKKGYLNRVSGKQKSIKKQWVILDGIRIRLYNSETDPDQSPLTEVVLKDIESITLDEQSTHPHTFVILLKENSNSLLNFSGTGSIGSSSGSSASNHKLIFSCDDRLTMAKWILAIDGLKFRCYNSCLNQFLKRVLLHNLYKENHKGGFIKSSFDEEWSYSSDGILQCTEANWNQENGGASNIVYLWDGQRLLPQNGSFSLGWGKWNGFIFEWRLGDVANDKSPKVLEYYWEESEREYLTEDDSQSWKWTRHFLTLKTGTGEWIVEGEIPEPVVFFLSLLRYSRLNHCNNINQATVNNNNNNNNNNNSV